MRGEECPVCGENLDQRAEGECCKNCLAPEDTMIEMWGNRRGKNWVFIG